MASRTFGSMVRGGRSLRCFASLLLLAAVLLATTIGCGSTRATAGDEERPAFVEVLPGVRVDRGRGIVEFEGEVPIDAYDASSPLVYLELIACSPDTREHETLVVTGVRPSHLHAGLLAAGFAPGRPATFGFDGGKLQRVAPEGDRVAVLVAVIESGGERGTFEPIGAWAKNEATGETMLEAMGAGAWVFAGSRVVDRTLRRLDGSREVIRYDADGTGTVIGLASFGSEVISLAVPISPAAAVDEPVWIARRGAVPERGTSVVVRLIRASDR